MGELDRPHFLGGSPEGVYPGTEGEGGPGQDPACIGLDVHLAPGHFPEGLPGAAEGYFLAFQQIPQQEGPGRQRGKGPSIQGGECTAGVGNGKGPAQELYLKPTLCKGYVRQAAQDLLRIQVLEQGFIVGKGDFFLVIFDFQ